ncbi:hypothetical protein D3C75_1230130 [compost metagenome]
MTLTIPGETELPRTRAATDQGAPVGLRAREVIAAVVVVVVAGQVVAAEQIPHGRVIGTRCNKYCHKTVVYWS